MSSVSALGSATSAQVWSGASMRKPPAQTMANLFNKIDTSGSGSITKAQFESAFQSMNPPSGFKSQGADAVWAKLDPNGTGSVSKQDFTSSMTEQATQLRQGRHHTAGTEAVSPQTLSSSLQSLNDLDSSSNNGYTPISIKV